MAVKGMMHLNGNVLCCIDCETTGLVAGYHDLIQICILPLNSDIKPLTEIDGEKIIPFYMELRPKRPENIDPSALKVHGVDLHHLMHSSIEPFKAADLFEEWIVKLKLPFRKRIAPLGQCYSFDARFIIDWLGNETYNQFFDGTNRDTASAALFCNDRASFQGSPPPYPKVNLAYLASQLQVSHGRAHDALQDCLVTSEIYRRMLQTPIF